MNFSIYKKKRNSNDGEAGLPVRSEKGFSAVEVLIVLVIIGILAVIAIPASLRQLQVHRLDSSVSIISSKVRDARMNAIKRNRTATLRLDKANRRAQIRSTDDANAAIDVGNPELFYQNVALDAANTVDINFDSMGRLTGAAQTVTLLESGSGKRKNISISPAGKVTVSGMY